MAYCGYVTRIKNLRKHPNADRLQLGECFGNVICVDLSYTEGQLGVYFPTDGQLSVEFATANNLLRLKDENGKSIGGYMDPKKRNVTTVKLRGEVSDGLFLPLTCLESFGNIKKLQEGDTIDTFNGHLICQKYIPPMKPARTSAGGAGTRSPHRAKRSIAPTFFEHKDTEQLAYNMDAFKPGDRVEITLKMHGTSQRTSHTKVLQETMRTSNAFAHFASAIFRKGKINEWLANKFGEPVYEWDYITGTRRTVLDTYDGGFYGDNSFREEHHNKFKGKLWKGETVYYEVVGFITSGQPIMASCSNDKIKDGGEFKKQYGDTTVFSYGCTPHAFCASADASEKGNDIYVYRMTMTTEDGDVVEYTPDFMRYRCEQMGVKTVPVLWQGKIPDHPASNADDTVTAGEWIRNVAERYYDGPDPIGQTHIREGVVIRLVDAPTFKAYKHKNNNFKILEGIIKENADAPDMEEADGLEAEEELQ